MPIKCIMVIGDLTIIIYVDDGITGAGAIRHDGARAHQLRESGGARGYTERALK